MNPAARAKTRFGPFEVDFAVRELRKHGVRLKLQKQPFQILAALLERPNEVVSREELRQQVWTDDTFVDFDHGVHAAMNKLRQALGDSSDNPRYIETVPGVGYKWVAPIDPVHINSSPSGMLSPLAGDLMPGPTKASRRPSGVWIGWLLPATILACGVIAGWYLRSATESNPAGRLTVFAVPPPEGFFFEPALTRQDFAVSPDGERLAFVASSTSKSRLWIGEIGSLQKPPGRFNGR